MYDDFDDDATADVPTNWKALVEHEHAATVARYADRFAAGRDIWTGRPCSLAAALLAETLAALARPKRGGRPKRR